jgi:hypothetical protein
MALTAVWNLAPVDRNQYHFFIFSEETLTKAEYIDYLMSRIIFFLLIYLIKPSRIFVYLWFGYLIDFLLNFNEADYHIGLIPVSYTSISFFIMLSKTGYDFYKYHFDGDTKPS